MPCGRSLGVLGERCRLAVLHAAVLIATRAAASGPAGLARQLANGRTGLQDLVRARDAPLEHEVQLAEDVALAACPRMLA